MRHNDANNMTPPPQPTICVPICLRKNILNVLDNKKGRLHFEEPPNLHIIAD